jgi:hypothetical protein
MRIGFIIGKNKTKLFKLIVLKINYLCNKINKIIFEIKRLNLKL